MVFALDRASLLIERLTSKLRPYAFETISFILVLGIVFFGSVADAFSLEVENPTLQDQDQVVAEMRAHLQPGDKIFVYGQMELLVLSRLPNTSKYLFLGRGKDTYLDQIEPGGFDGWLERIRAERPKVIALGRLGPVDQAAKLESLVKYGYVRRDKGETGYYLRIR